MEEEEQRSLELMRGIAEANARLRSREKCSDGGDAAGPPRRLNTNTNRGGGGRTASRSASSQPRLQMQPSRGSTGRKRLKSGW